MKVKLICNLKLKTPCVKLLNNKLKKLLWCATIFLSGNQISSLPKKVFQIWLNTFYWKETSHVSEESEKPITSESQEFLALKSSTDLKKSNNLMLVLNADCSILEKLVMNISHTLLNVKIQLLAPSCWEVHQRMFWTKWKEISTTVWVFLRTFIVIQDWFQEEEPLKWKSLQELMKKVANTQVSNNFHSKQVFFYLNFSRLRFGNYPKNFGNKLWYGCR